MYEEYDRMHDLIWAEEPMNPLTEQEEQKFNSSRSCYLSNQVQPLVAKDKVRDHCHYTLVKYHAYYYHYILYFFNHFSYHLLKTFWISPNLSYFIKSFYIFRGRYLGPAHSKCNFKRQTDKHLPIVFHNFKVFLLNWYIKIETLVKLIFFGF